MEVSCCICNKIHEKKKSLVLRNKNNYCSPECYSKKLYDNLEVNCMICNKKYIKKMSVVKNSYCSDKCRTKAYYIKYPEKMILKTENATIKARIKKGIPLDSPMRAQKGCGTIDKNGYKIIKCHKHPNSRKKGDMFEHTFIMSEYLKRPLIKGERIHHKNGIRTDNRIENLELWNITQPSGQRVKDRLTYYKEFIEQYGGKVDLSTIPEVFKSQET